MGWRDTLRRRLFGPDRQTPEQLAANQDLRDLSIAARGAYWSQVGELDPNVLGEIIPSGLTGRPRWPTLRKAFCVVRRGGATLLASDGLSDPDDNPRGERHGRGVELFLETADIAPELADVGRLGGGWALAVLQMASDEVAGIMDAPVGLDRYGALVFEAPGVMADPRLAAQLPARFVGAADSLGVLIGGVPADFAPDIADMPGPVRAVPLILLTVAEMDALRGGGLDARRDVAAALAKLPTGHRSSLTRESVA